MRFRFSQVISYLLHPMFIPIFSVLIVIRFPALVPNTFSSTSTLLIILKVSLFTIFIPALVSILMVKLRVIDSLVMLKREQRNIPLLVTSSSYLVMIYTLKSSGIPSAVLYILYTAMFALLVGMLVNLFYKISLHTLGWGGMAASFAGLMLQTGFDFIAIVLASIAVAGLVGYARLNEKAHTQIQIYSGFCLGFFSVLALTFLGT